MQRRSVANLLYCHLAERSVSHVSASLSSFPFRSWSSRSAPGRSGPLFRSLGLPPQWLSSFPAGPLFRRSWPPGGVACLSVSVGLPSLSATLSRVISIGPWLPRLPVRAYPISYCPPLSNPMVRAMSAPQRASTPRPRRPSQPSPARGFFFSPGGFSCMPVSATTAFGCKFARVTMSPANIAILIAPCIPCLPGCVSSTSPSPPRFGGVFLCGSSCTAASWPGETRRLRADDADSHPLAARPTSADHGRPQASAFCAFLPFTPSRRTATSTLKAQAWTRQVPAIGQRTSTRRPKA